MRRLLALGSVVVVLFGLPGVAFGGVDGDGDLDVVVAVAEPPASSACLGDGDGDFTCSDFGTSARSVALGDVNGDGSIDAILGRVGPTNLACLGNGSGGFACSDMSPDEETTLGVALGDVDGDGHLDVVVANGSSGMNQVCLGDGLGKFVCSDVSVPRRTNDAAVGDLNGDGDLDIVWANEGQRNQACLGDGSGSFSCSDVNSESNNTIDLDLGDFDNDGTQDVVFGNNGESNRICLGAGNGSFVCGVISPATNPTFGVSAGDVNGDGDLDVVFGNEGARNTVCIGAGSGGFSCSFVSGDSNNTWDVEVGDVDRDGNLDAVFANFNPPTGQRDRVCLGNGSGSFSCQDLSNDTLVSHNLAIAPGHRGTFIDDDFSVFEGDIEWIADEGITKGCNPPINDLFCPDEFVTRGQMAAFMVRAMGYSDNGGGDLFVDDDGNTFENDIDKLATAGVTKGCNPPTNNRYCPEDFVTRGQMAAFMVRALGYTDDGGGDLFVDDDGNTFENDIDKLGTAGVTKGCNPPTNDEYCPNDFVTRGQMAAFLRRALDN